MNNFNKLNTSELERLAILAEECSEVIQIVNKIIRHGYESCNPNIPNITNRYNLIKGIGHTLNIIDMMKAKGDLDMSEIEVHKMKKSQEISKYLHHN